MHVFFVTQTDVDNNENILYIGFEESETDAFIRSQAELRSGTDGHLVLVVPQSLRKRKFTASGTIQDLLKQAATDEGATEPVELAEFSLTVQSESDPDTYYGISLNERGEADACTCPGFQYHDDKPCKHMRGYIQPTAYGIAHGPAALTAAGWRKLFPSLSTTSLSFGWHYTPSILGRQPAEKKVA